MTPTGLKRKKEIPFHHALLFVLGFSNCFRQYPTCTRWQENDTGLVVQRFVGDLLEKLDGELLQLDSDQLERLSNTGPDYTMCNANDN